MSLKSLELLIYAQNINKKQRLFAFYSKENLLKNKNCYGYGDVSVNKSTLSGSLRT